LRRVNVYVPTAVSRVVVMEPLVVFIIIVGYEPTLPPLPAICRIEYDRPLINAAAVEEPAAADEANNRTTAGDVGAPVTTVRVYGVYPIM
jgi:hypothetical protein